MQSVSIILKETINFLIDFFLFSNRSDALFDIWNKFEPRITKRHFYQKLMQIGEFLVQHKV